MHSEPIPGQARAASTVVMLRDGSAGLEAFLLERHGLSEILAGVHVFPGGKLDREDADPDTLARLDQPLEALHDHLGEPGLDHETAAALHVAAIREVFEETGVLFARGADDAVAQRAWALHREGHAFGEVLALLGLTLQTGNMLPWSRWITPLVGGVIRKRFDTRFFVVAMQPGQQARHDDHEAVASVWLTPRAALEQYRDEKIELAPPQIMTLAHLMRHTTVAGALAEARGRRPPLVQPESFHQDGLRVLCYPGDERHPVRERAMPGPTRLCHDGQRFKPIGGFDEFFR